MSSIEINSSVSTVCLKDPELQTHCRHSNCSSAHWIPQEFQSSGEVL